MLLFTQNDDRSLTPIDSSSIASTRPTPIVTAIDGAISINDNLIYITKGSAAALTLAAPTADQNGTEVILVAGSAFAHVVTATGLIADGVTGGYKNTVTLGAFVGACCTLVAYGLKWIVKSKTVATIA